VTIFQPSPGLLKMPSTRKCGMDGSTSFCTAILVPCPVAPTFRGFSNYVLRGGERVSERGKSAVFLAPSPWPLSPA
jgi:hypothetical protein